MLNYKIDNRIVMTLDAGGTNFVFTAIQGSDEIVKPISSPSFASDLDKNLDMIINGFEQVQNKIGKAPSAISFGFPGPADYTRGIIEKLGNLPAYNRGTALGPMLQHHFKLPVYINNDGDLFAYGESIGGFLPYVNDLLEKNGNKKHYNNIFGVTLGTGFGGGLVRENQLYIGDNSAASEVWLLRHKFNPNQNVEEGLSKRAVRNYYARNCSIPIYEAPTVKKIFEIGIGKKKGNRKVAKQAFYKLGELLGDALAQICTITDSLLVIGGGLAGAYDLFSNVLIEEINNSYNVPNGDNIPRMEVKAFNLESDEERTRFIKGNVKDLKIPRTNKFIKYDSQKRIGVGISKLGTSKAISIGAYTFAINQLDALKG
jgi:glucokinase